MTKMFLPKKANPQRSEKQRIIMGLILSAADEGEYLNVKKIHNRVPYTCTYGAIRITLRYLHHYEMVVREPDPDMRHSNLYKPTAKGYAWFRTSD